MEYIGYDERKNIVRECNFLKYTYIAEIGAVLLNDKLTQEDVDIYYKYNCSDILDLISYEDQDFIGVVSYNFPELSENNIEFNVEESKEFKLIDAELKRYIDICKEGVSFLLETKQQKDILKWYKNIRVTCPPLYSHEYCFIRFVREIILNNPERYEDLYLELTI